MKGNTEVSRRAFLRGLGTLVALPALEGLMPRKALGALAKGAGETLAHPNRLAFFYVPNGIIMPDWTPSREGADFDLPTTLAPLTDLKQDILVLSGLAQRKGFANGDGAGDHARAAASFLTGVQARKTHGADIKNGISADQAAAQQVGHLTRFPSLELGCEPGRQAGNCDSGYSCAYSNTIAWKSETQPLMKEIDPRQVFQRLFAGGSTGEAEQARARRERYQKSLLDFVLEDARRLRGQLGPIDRRKLDEYLEGVREIETRLERVEKEAEAEAGRPTPAGIPKDYGEHLQLMCDMLVLAFQADLTRVATFMMANEGSNRSYRSIGVPDGHHDLSHHGGNQEKQSKIQKINRFHMEHFAGFLKKLKSIPEGDGTLLDHSMIVYGSGLSDGNRHDHARLPILIAGRGSGTIKSGRHVRYSRQIPLNNLFLSLLDRMDSSLENLGDSTGRVPFLYGETRSF